MAEVMLYAVAFFAPLMGALIAGLLGRAIGDRAAELVAVVVMIVSAICGMIVFAPLVVITLWMGIHRSSFSGSWAATVATMIARYQAALHMSVKFAAVIP